MVDDDPQLRAVISRKLVAEGLTVDLAEDGDHAVHLLEESRYEVVLLDWVMPKMSGQDVVAFLRSSQPERSERVVVITAADSDALPDIDRSIVKAVLFKPLELAALVGHVRALIA